MHSDSLQKTAGTANLRALTVALLAAGLALSTACKDDATVETNPPETNTAGAKTNGDKANSAGAAVVEDGELTKYKKEARLRYSMTDLVHFADRDNDGTLFIDLGTVGARKYTGGGWRTGWNPENRKDGETTYYEADAKSARVFFKHRGDVEKIIVRMKAVKSSNKVVFYLNDKALSNTEIDGEWKDYPVEVNKDAVRKGENQFMMRFTHDTTSEGRKQVAHIASVHVVPKGKSKDDAPRGPAVSKLSFGGVGHDALTAATPQTFTYRVEVPKTGKPKLGLHYGAKAPGGKITVTAEADTVKKATLLDVEVTEGKTGKWMEKVLDLSPFAGKVTEIALTAGGTWKDGQLVGFGEPALYTTAVDDGATEAKAKGVPAKNVLIYLIDTMRYDKFGVYNDKSSVPTPNIDAFAKDGTIFDAAYTNENWTKPSCATILTGLYPETHKTKEDDSKLPQSVTTLGEHLKEHEFRTASFIANGYVSDAFGFKQGWDYYTNYIREKKVTDAERLVDDTLGWLDKNKDKGRWFVYMQTIDPHVPYSAPGEWKFKHRRTKYDGPIKPQATGNQLADIKTGKMNVTARDKKYLEELYDGEVAYNDAEFGRLVKGLKERGVYDDTVIIIITDHGEEFFEHGSVGHGHSLYEELVHSPLFIRYPNRIPTGRRVPHTVSMVDLAPTITDLLGVPAMEDVEGTSFTDTFDGVGNPHPRVAVADFLYRKKTVRAGHYSWKTIGRGGELFDLSTDPNEKKDVILKHWIGRAYARAHFGMFMGAGDKSTWWENSDKRKTVAVEADSADLDDELQDQLEAMGYVQGAKGEGGAEEDKKKMEEEDNK